MRPSSTLLLLTLFIASIFLSCEQKDNTKEETGEIPSAEFDLEASRKTIKQKTIRFTEAHITKDTAYLNNIFTDDARIFPPNSDVVSGKKAIATLNTDWVNYGIHEFTEASTACYGNADYIIDEGTYHLRYGEENTIDDGKYINIWKNVNSDWKIYSNIWNTSLPYPAAN